MAHAVPMRRHDELEDKLEDEDPLYLKDKLKEIEAEIKRLKETFMSALENLQTVVKTSICELQMDERRGTKRPMSNTPSPQSNTHVRTDEQREIKRLKRNTPSPQSNTPGKNDEGRGTKRGVSNTPLPQSNTPGKNDEGRGTKRGVSNTPSPQSNTLVRTDDQREFKRLKRITPSPQSNTPGKEAASCRRSASPVRTRSRTSRPYLVGTNSRHKKSEYSKSSLVHLNYF